MAQAIMCQSHVRQFRQRAGGPAIGSSSPILGSGRCRRSARARPRRAPAPPTAHAATATPTTSGGGWPPRPVLISTPGNGGRLSPRSPRTDRSACTGCRRWWSCRCCSGSASALAAARRSPTLTCGLLAARSSASRSPRSRSAIAAASQARRSGAKIHALARLSESPPARPDHGDLPAALGRADIEAFLNRLGYLESAGTISRYHRNVICRGARTVLAGIRGMGVTRPGRSPPDCPTTSSSALPTFPPSRCAASPAVTCHRRS